MAIYSERPPIPKQTTHLVTPGSPMREDTDQRVSRSADAVREVEVLAVLNREVAQRLHTWLEQKLKQWDQINKTFEEQALAYDANEDTADESD